MSGLINFESWLPTLWLAAAAVVLMFAHAALSERGGAARLLSWTLNAAVWTALIVAAAFKLWTAWSGYSLAFDAPWYLLLLFLAPLIWIYSFRGLSGLGPCRRLFALGLRTAVLVLLVLAIAGVQVKRTTDQLTVIYLLDQSESIPPVQRGQMIEFVNQAIRRHRQSDDRAGVIVFGRNSAVEVPPFDVSFSIPNNLETLVDREATNLESAVKLAQASFPPGAARRLVIVSDGNENIGDATTQARRFVQSGGNIDVLPVYYQAGGDVLVEKLSRPSNVRKGQPFDLTAVLTNNNALPVPGRLEFRMRTGDQWTVLNSDEDLPPEQRGTSADPQYRLLEPGKNVFRFRLKGLDQPDYYTYQARFFPLAGRGGEDAIRENNEAVTHVHVRGSGRVLLIEDHEQRGEHTALVEALKRNDVEVETRGSDAPFANLLDLQQFDAIVLANVPREDFSDAQIAELAKNTEHAGCGLVMLGGANSFGAGGWTDTAVEHAMPLDFRIKNSKVLPKGALAMIMHAAETGDGNNLMKNVAVKAIEALGEQDLVGLAHWNGVESWLWNRNGSPPGLLPIRDEAGDNRPRMTAALGRMFPGDMPDFDPTLKMALQSLNGVQDAAVKHVIVISDGDPVPPTPAVVQQFVAGKITISTVEVAAHGNIGLNTMSKLAADTGGKFYKIKEGQNKTIPRIFQKEARRVARPLIHEEPAGFAPQVAFHHEWISGIEGFPALTGYVMTTPKENSLVEISLTAPRPEGRTNALLARWSYGLGKSVCFTSDAGGARWTKAWTDGWSDYDRFFTQVIRWSMRPPQEEGEFSLITEITEDRKVRVIVTALDEDEGFQNLLEMAGSALGPGGKPIEVRMEQVAPGRYVGEFDAPDSGGYLVTVRPAPQAPTLLRSGVSVPYASEYRFRATNEPLLRSLAGLAPPEGQAGSFIEARPSSADGQSGFDVAAALNVNSFRHDLPRAESLEAAWTYVVVLAACLFFADVFVRRVQVRFGWLATVSRNTVGRLLGRAPDDQPPEYIARLRGRKQEVADEIEQRKAAARFEPDSRLPAADAPPFDRSGDASSPPSTPTPDSGPRVEEETYTDRLLKAKKRVWEERDK